MRGKRSERLGHGRNQRNIPAYAGKTSQVIEGEYQVTGTSPRMRGKPGHALIEVN